MAKIPYSVKLRAAFTAGILVRLFEGYKIYSQVLIFPGKWRWKFYSQENIEKSVWLIV